MKFERFEDILAWQKARVLVNKVYRAFLSPKIMDSMTKYSVRQYRL